MKSVFISYVHEDVRFARFLAAALRAAGHNPWLDEERLISGDPLEDELTAQIAQMNCGVFLVASRFHKSDHCMNELRIFAERFPNLPRHPILRRARNEVDLPAYLSRLVTLDWIDDQTNSDEAVHQLLCAIDDREPGPKEEWAEKGRKATATMPAELITPPSVDPRGSARVAGSDIRSIECDRGREWNLFQSVYPQPVHHVALIAGAREDAHDYFVVRIEQFLKIQPPFRRANVDLRVRPKTKGEYLERLSLALTNERSRDADVAAELRRWMARENLILIHTAIENRYEDQTLLEYYRELLPELLEQAKPAFSLKCIQPIVWDSSSRVPAAIRKWFAGSKWLLSAAEKNGRALIERMQSFRTGATATISIELGPIDEHEIRDFCQAARFTAAESEQLLEEIRDNDITSTVALLDHIDGFMLRRRKPA